MNLKTESLKRGDILLYHGHHPLSKLIRYFDESSYNHCAIYDQDNYVFEATSEGVERKTIHESIQQSEAIVVTSWRLNNPPENMEPIIEKAKTFSNTDYPVSQLLLLAGILMRKRMTKNSPLFDFTSKYFHYAINELEQLSGNDYNQFLPSELVYKTFNTQQNSKFHIDFTHQKSFKHAPKAFYRFLKHSKKVHRIKSLSSNKTDIFEEFEDYKTDNNQTTKVIKRIFSDISEIVNPKSMDELYAKNKTLLMESSPKIAHFLSHIDLSQLVTPGDIARASNLKKQSTILYAPEQDWLCDYL